MPRTQDYRKREILDDMGILQRNIEKISDSLMNYKRVDEFLSRYAESVESEIDRTEVPADVKKDMRICTLLSKELGALGKFYLGLERRFPKDDDRRVEIVGALDEAKAYMERQEDFGLDRHDEQAYDRLRELRDNLDSPGAKPHEIGEEAREIIEGIVRRAKKIYETKMLEVTMSVEV